MLLSLSQWSMVTGEKWARGTFLSDMMEFLIEKVERSVQNVRFWQHLPNGNTKGHLTRIEPTHPHVSNINNQLLPAPRSATSLHRSSLRHVSSGLISGKYDSRFLYVNGARSGHIFSQIRLEITWTTLLMLWLFLWLIVQYICRPTVVCWTEQQHSVC